MAYKFNRHNAVDATRFLGVCIIGVLACLIAYWLVGKYPPTDSASAAAWVQAFGAIVAIVIAIVIPYQQRAAEQKLRLYEYWSRRAEIEYRMDQVASDVVAFFDSIVEITRPRDNSTLIVSYDGVAHAALDQRLSALENANPGISGHERLAVLHNVLKRLQAHCRNRLSISPDSTFSRDLSEGPIAQDARNCLADTKQKLAGAQAWVAKFNMDSPPESL